MQNPIVVELPFATITLWLDIDLLAEHAGLRFKTFAGLPTSVFTVADSATAMPRQVGIKVEYDASAVAHVANRLVFERIIETLEANGLTAGPQGPYGHGYNDTMSGGMSNPMMRRAEISVTNNGLQCISITTDTGFIINSLDASAANINRAATQQPMMRSAMGPWVPIKRPLKGTFSFDGRIHNFTIEMGTYELSDYMSDDDIVANIYQEVYTSFPFVEKHNLLMNVRLD